MPHEESLEHIEALVQEGRAVMTADDSGVVEAVRDAIRYGRTATFYVSHRQAEIVNRTYWTPARVEALGVEAVSREERERIEQELGVPESGSLYSNRIPCECGAVYGAFEFVAQGVREHGREAVNAVLQLQATAVIRVNPAQTALCAGCGQALIIGHHYQWVNKYGCCTTGDIVVPHPAP